MPALLEAWIGGSFVSPAGDEYLDVEDPSSARVLCRVARCGERDVEQAVKTARRALKHWRSLAHRERGLGLRRIASILESRVEDLARLETLDCGKPISQSRQDVLKAAESFAYYSELADKRFGKTVPVSDRYLNYTRLEPRGVTAHISPWNYPLRLAVRSIAPALACGNTVVHKPAEQTPLTALALGEVMAEAGIPEGVYNVVPGYGIEAGAALARHPGVDQISFTGSLEVGIEVLRAAAANVIPVVPELGGKSANIVFSDADLDAAARGVKKGIFTNAGQVCCAGSRLLVAAEVEVELLERLLAETRKMRLGPGLDDPDMGPLISARHRARVQRAIELASREGARLVLGGGVPGTPGCRQGYFLEPTIFDSVEPRMSLAREEIFGPVLSVSVFRDDEQALDLANASGYGLVAGVWTRDLGRAHRTAATLEVGQVYVNDFFTGSMGDPFGGCKRSGYGRERGLEALDNYTQVKSVCITL